MAKITLDDARKVLKVVDKGLSQGKGQKVPGKMCVEAAVSFAMGEDDWTDQPICVDADVRDLKIHINDYISCSNKTRAKILRRLSIAQLGTVDIDMGNFTDRVIDALIEASKVHNLRLINLKLPRLLTEFKQQLIDGYSPELSASDFNLIVIGDNEDVDDAFDTFVGGYKNLQMAHEACEIIVKVLVKLKSPGAKFLKLAPFKPLPKGAK